MKLTGGHFGAEWSATAFAKAGAKVVVTGRRGKEGADVIAKITKKGGMAAFVRGDVAKEADVVNFRLFSERLAGQLKLGNSAHADRKFKSSKLRTGQSLSAFTNKDSTEGARSQISRLA